MYVRTYEERMFSSLSHQIEEFFFQKIPKVVLEYNFIEPYVR